MFFKRMLCLLRFFIIYLLAFFFLSPIIWADDGKYDTPWQNLPVDEAIKPYLVSVLGGENVRIINDEDVNGDGIRKIVAVRPLGRPWGRKDDMSLQEETIINGVVVQIEKDGILSILLEIGETGIISAESVFLKEGSKEWILTMSKTGLRTHMISVADETISDGLSFVWDAKLKRYFLVTFDIPPGRTEGVEMVPFYGTPEEWDTRGR